MSGTEGAHPGGGPPVNPADARDFLHPYFLGPAAENDRILEELVVEFLRDHAYWRRNFHPEDGLRIGAGARNQPEFLEFLARIRQELYTLSADLKRALPMYHPRYVGHMTGDLLLPGLVAKLVTTLYNPNNVSEEAAPITLEKELQVGEQLARMFGYPVGPGSEIRAWGHLTSGGTVANYEALWNFRSVKFYGVALQAGAREAGVDPGPVGPAGKPLEDYTPWELVNLTLDQMVALRKEVAARVAGMAAEGRASGPHSPARLLDRFFSAVRDQRLENLGTAEFFRRHPDLPPPVVLAPVSAHYSWDKGMKVLGLGRANLLGVAVDEHMRMDPADLRVHLDRCFGDRIPVLAAVGVLGSTEFGTVDPIHRICDLRDECRARGQDVPVHVDAAWGGYLASVFRNPDGSMAPREELAQEYRYFPSEALYEAFRAVPRTDSVTVDPHKLGYVPYAAGAFVARNRDVVDFVTQQAPYVFDVEGPGDPGLGREGARREGSGREGSGPAGSDPGRDRLRNLGQYILEGSKPGASAAAVYVTHKVLPLDRTGFGRLLGETVRACEYFWDSARSVADRLAGQVHLCVPFEPDSNLICIALNPVGNRDLARMNRFGRRLFREMKMEADRPVQVKTFIGSYTSLQKSSLPGRESVRILAALDIDPATFTHGPEDPEREADHIFVLRHTLMNPWLMDGPGGRSYVDLYWDYLESLIRDALGSEG